jgi:LysR family glycine cleavage system transcriptional activator
MISEILNWLVEQTQNELNQLKVLCDKFGWSQADVTLG